MTSVGMNLSPVNYYSTEFPFIDRMKMSSGWAVYSQPVAADALGNPIAIPAGAPLISTAISLDPVAAAPTDIYVLTYQGGAANIQVTGTNVISSEPGKIVFQHTATSSAFENLIIFSMSATDPVHDIHVVRQDDVSAFAAGKIFNPEFLAQVSNWQALRFMDWQNTNDSTITSWADRPHVENVSWAANTATSAGVPIEVMIQLANESRTDLWFNVPTQADDTYVRNALQLIKDQLAPGLKVHVEYSNEVWNTGFQQNQYAQTMANKMWAVDANHNGVIDGGESLARGDQVYYGYRAAQIASIANSVFSGVDDSRLEMVLATQTGNAGLEEYFLNGIARANAGSVSTLFDEVAGHDYFGAELSGQTAADQAKVIGWANSGEAGLAAAFNELAHGDGMDIAMSVDAMAPYLRYEKSFADRYGLNFVAYEGGLHGSAVGYGADQSLIQDFFARLLADPRMTDLYKYWFDTFKNAGGTLMAAFNDVQAPNVFGTFGTLNSLYDAKTPRYDALLAEAAPKSSTVPTTTTTTTTTTAPTTSTTSPTATTTTTTTTTPTSTTTPTTTTPPTTTTTTTTTTTKSPTPTSFDPTVKTALASATLDATHTNLTYIGTGDFVGTGNGQDNVITGGAGADKLYGGAGNDTLVGGAGADLLDGGTGADKMVGGLGNDVYVVDHVGDVVTEQANEGTDEVRTTLADYTLGANVENLTFTGSGDFSAHGNALANVITGGAGNDSIDGGLGADRMIGGLGNDTYWVNDARDVVVEQAGQGTDTVITSVNYTLAANVENVTLAKGATTVHGNDLGNTIREYVGGSGSYTLYGEGGDDSILGSDAVDTIYGGSGADKIMASGGNDVLVGGTGVDWLSGGLGADRFVFAPGDSGATRATADMIADFSRAERDKIDLTAFDANPATQRHDPLRFIGSADFTHHAGELRVVGGDIQIDLNGDGVSDFAIVITNGAVLTSGDFIL